MRANRRIERVALTAGQGEALANLKPDGPPGRRPQLVRRASLIPFLILIFSTPRGSHLSGQQPGATAGTKITATSVAVDVIVTDHQGRHVSGLAAGDFRIHEAEGAKGWSVLSLPANELAKTIHELKGISPATGQDELLPILKRLGDNAESFVRNIPNTASREEIEQQTLDSESDFVTQEFRYLVLAEPGALAAQLNEFRQDSKGHTVEEQGTMRGSPIVTRGFVSLPLVFHPQHQGGSGFRLVGRQAIAQHEAYVIAFAQHSVTPLSIRMNTTGSWATFLIQGVAWVDTGTCQILRMKTWLLPGQTKIADVTTTVDFGEVHFKQNSLAFWLPRDVVVGVVWKGKLYTNHHHYSGYRFFSVEAGEKPPGR